MERLAKLRLPLLVLFTIMAAGTLGYRILYPVPLIDAFYMTVISISTVGFREAFPLDSAGKLFTIALILCGLGGMTFTLSSLFQFMIEGHLLGLVKRRQMEKSLESLRDHYIICGYGRVGEQIRSKKRPACCCPRMAHPNDSRLSDPRPSSRDPWPAASPTQPGLPIVSAPCM